ncbi:MAG: hypothetical protein II167_02525, partial [Clostridiales bacterium]|nr:hypothetical protein [Clostridiales bacterium]
DSFGRALLPLMIDNYENASFRRTDVPDVVSFPDGGDFVYEIVERNLPRVIGKVPFMYAPVRDASVIGQTADGGEVEVNLSFEGYGIKLYGALDDDAETGDGRVYISMTNGSDTEVFEAFPVYENDLMDEAGTCGFSAIISKDDISTGTYDVDIICGGYIYNGGQIVVE